MNGSMTEGREAWRSSRLSREQGTVGAVPRTVCLFMLHSGTFISAVTESYPLVVIQPCTVDIVLEILLYHSTAR